MTNAGWYPDPAGAPDTYRYWDGQSWSQMTTSQPPAAAGQPTPPQQPQQPQPPQQPQQAGYGAVPPTPAPGGYPSSAGGHPGAGGGYGQPAWSPQPGGSSGGGSGRTIAIIVAAVVALVLLGVGGFFGVRALTGDDDAKAGDDSSETTDESDATDATDETAPTDETSSTITPTGIQCSGGTADPEMPPAPKAKQLTGGGLTLPRLDGYTLATGGNVAFSFPDDFVLQYVEVEEYWISLTGVGGLSKANGFDDVATAAEVILQCLTSNDQIYKGFTGRTDLKNEAIDISGKPAHHLRSEVRVDDARVTVEGDVVDVIVVDTGDADSFGVYISMAAIADDQLIARNEDVTARLKAD